MAKVVLGITPIGSNGFQPVKLRPGKQSSTRLSGKTKKELASKQESTICIN